MTLLAFIVVLGVLVFVHELGHFLVARWSGVTVETFSIGFGPTIASIQREGVLYKIGIVPLGGYVKMKGDQTGTEEAEAPDSYLAQPKHKRAAIVVAGPVMNLLTAFVLAPIVYMVGVPEPVHLEDPPVLGWIDAEWRERIPVGSRVKAIDGESVSTWREFQTALSMSEGKAKLDIATAGGSARTVTIGTTPVGSALEKLLPPMPPVIERVVPDSAAAAAGLQPNDRIAAISDVTVTHWAQIGEVLAESHGAPVTITVQRGTETTAMTASPRYDEAQDRYMLGIARQEAQTIRQYGFGASVRYGTGRVVEMSLLTFEIIGRLVQGDLSLKALGGPVAIAQGAGNAARAGVGAFLTFMVFISVQLGVLNLLPIPVLDGGHLVIIGAETVIGRRLPDRWVELAQWLGLIFLLGLMLYVTRNDIMRFWGDTLQQWFGVG